MSKRSEAAQDLFLANQAVQRRTRILQREERIQLLERYIAHMSPCNQYRKVYEFEIQRMREEIKAEGPDQP